MLSDNIKTLRKSKGLTQEELANRINVVRQTVSKWEKGYSVPDAEILKKIAEVLETDVSQLLGSTIEIDANADLVAEQLSRINEQLAIRNRRARRIWKTVGVIFLVILAVQIIVLSLGSVSSVTHHTDSQVEEITKD